MASSGGRAVGSWHETFFHFLEEGAHIGRACAEAGISRSAAYAARYSDPEFARRWTEAMDIGLQTLHDEAVRRARDGTVEPIYHQGKQVGTVRRYSDSLLALLLRAHDPARFDRPKRSELSGPEGGPLDFDVEHHVSADQFERTIGALINALGITVPDEDSER